MEDNSKAFKPLVNGVKSVKKTFEDFGSAAAESSQTNSGKPLKQFTEELEHKPGMVADSDYRVGFGLRTDSAAVSGARNHDTQWGPGPSYTSRWLRARRAAFVNRARGHWQLFRVEMNVATPSHSNSR